MEAFATYLLKSVTWLTGFALVYLLFLRNERYFMLKRVFLIAGILISFLFPLISFHYRVDVPVPEIDQQALMAAGIIPVAQITPDKPFDFRLPLMLVYLTGVLILGFKIIWQVGSLFRTINEEQTENKGLAKLVRAKSFPVSFSFFNYIFINPSVSGEELKEIINHELVHVKQKHWFDLLLAEILSMLQWMNPFVWIYTGFIKMNHEYLADQEVLRHSSNPANYRAALLNQLFRAPVICLSNSFHYSINKRRFDMMKMKITSPYRKMKMLLIVPVLAIIFYAFATPEYNYLTATANVLPENEASFMAPGVVKGNVTDKDNKPVAGVNIVVTGIYTGVTTDASGNFTIDNVPDNASLVISRGGYNTQFIRADFSREMKIILTINPEYKEPQIQFRTYEFGSTVAKPLIVIDGVISINGSEKNLPPSEIESVNILKDKAAVDKYGERGKEGVIEITTRKKGIRVTDSSDEAPFVIVEEMPMYPGGDVALLKFILENTKYPEDAKLQKIQGRVIVRFYVNKEGNVAEVTALKGVHPSLDAEAVRVVSMLEGFSPGRQGGIAVNTWFSVPVTFTLDTGPAGEGLAAETALKAQTTELAGQIQTPESSGKIQIPEPPEKSLAQGSPGQIQPGAHTPEDAPFVIVEQMPSYPGGDIALLNFVRDNTQYPEEAKVSNIQGRVIVRFIVTKDGGTANATVMKGVDPLLDEEALRVVNNLGDNWIPGEQGGVPVDVWFSVPITFTLK